MTFSANPSAAVSADLSAGWTPELMMQVKKVGSVQVSPNGRRVAFAVRKAVMEGDRSEFLTHIHLAQSDGSESRQLTHGEKSCDAPQWSPDGEWLGFISNRVGKKNVWLLRVSGGEAVQLTESGADVGSFKWSPDGLSIAYTAADAPTSEEETRDRQKNDARVVDEHFKQARLWVVPVNLPVTKSVPGRALTKPDFNVVARSFDWSPDGKNIAFTHTENPTEDNWPSASISTIDVTSGNVKSLSKSAAAETSPYYSPDGQSIAYLVSDAPATWAGSRNIHVIAAQGGETRRLAEAFDGMGRYSELIGWSKAGDRLYFTEACKTRLRIMALPLNGAPVEISQQEGMSLGGVFLNSTRTHVGFGWETLTKPPEAFVGSITEFKPVAVSQIHRDLPNVPSGKTEIIRWKSSDGQEVEGLLTYPVGYQKGQRYPLLLVIHGGPMGVFTQTFDGNATQYPVAAFAVKGYAVLRPNPRGSSGYGKKFRYANYNDWGGGDYQDIMTGVDHVIGMGIADGDRMGVMGWSYGGFMTAWAITHTKRFRAASVGAGVTNLVSFTGTADIPSFLPDYFAGEFWDKLEPYRAHSPMFHVKGVTTPTLIQHGDKDERVPLSQGQELYNALKRQGCQTKLVIYPRTTHAIEEPRLLLDCMQRNIEWFDKHVGKS